MAVNGRAKGKRGERGAIDVLQPVVNEVAALFGVEPIELGRNLDQCKDGGYDLKGLPWFAFEVKYREDVNLSGWWEQAKAQAEREQEPVLIWRSNNQPWRVRMYGYLYAADTNRIRCPVDISIEAFLAYMKARLIEEFVRCGYPRPS